MSSKRLWTIVVLLLRSKELPSLDTMDKDIVSVWFLSKDWLKVLKDLRRRNSNTYISMTIGQPPSAVCDLILKATKKRCGDTAVSKGYLIRARGFEQPRYCKCFVPLLVGNHLMFDHSPSSQPPQTFSLSPDFWVHKNNYSTEQKVKKTSSSCFYLGDLLTETCNVFSQCF